MATVGGRRRKSAEEQYIELQARAHQTIIRAGRKEVEDITQKRPDTVTAFLDLAADKGWRMKESNNNDVQAEEGSPRPTKSSLR